MPAKRAVKDGWWGGNPFLSQEPVWGSRLSGREASSQWQVPPSTRFSFILDILFLSASFQYLLPVYLGRTIWSTQISYSCQTWKTLQTLWGLPEATLPDRLPKDQGREGEQEERGERRKGHVLNLCLSSPCRTSLHNLQGRSVYSCGLLRHQATLVSCLATKLMPNVRWSESQDCPQWAKGCSNEIKAIITWTEIEFQRLPERIGQDGRCRGGGRADARGKFVSGSFKLSEKTW